MICVCEPNISAVCPLSSPTDSQHVFCILSWLAVRSMPSSSTESIWYSVHEDYSGRKTDKESAASKQQVGDRPAIFKARCSNAESWRNAEIWATDRLRPCQHILLMSPRHNFIVGLCARVGKQQKKISNKFSALNCFLQFNFINHNVSHIYIIVYIWSSPTLQLWLNG